MGEAGEALHLLGRWHVDADCLELGRIHAREHRDGAHGRRLAFARRFRKALAGALFGGLHHVGTAACVHREQVGTRLRYGICRAVDLMGDVMQLEIEEDPEAELVHRVHDGGPDGVVKRHADLDPARMPGELLAQHDGLVG